MFYARLVLFCLSLSTIYNFRLSDGNLLTSSGEVSNFISPINSQFSATCVYLLLTLQNVEFCIVEHGAVRTKVVSTFKIKSRGLSFS